MTERLLRELAWLPRPAGDWRAEVRELSPGTRELASRVTRLANHALDLNQLVRLADCITRLRASDGGISGLTPFRLGLASNATTQILAPALIASGARYGLDVEIVEAPYDQILQTALDPESALNRAAPDAVLLAIDERALPLEASPGSIEQARSAVDRALDWIDTVREGIRAACGAPCIVPTIARTPLPLFGSLDARLPATRQRLIDAFNLALGEHLSGGEDLILDVAGLAQTSGLADWHDPVQWNLAKLAFSQERVPLYTEHVARLVAALRGRTRRCLVLDLDNTLWGGVVADDGVEGLILGQGDPLGEAFLDIQRTALALRERGIVLAVCSKNTEANARAPFREHPDMLLRESHIAVLQANFEDKASNLQAIADALDLGTDTLVLLDDNPAERAQVRGALPAVAVPELPDDPAYYARVLRAAGYFESVTFSDEDRERAQMYQANARRVAVQRRVGDLDAYLRELEMEITFAPFDAVGRERIAQLINKSNQYNLTTRRYTSAEVSLMEQDPRLYTLQVRLRDRFGDNGMISVVICHKAPSDWTIDSWLMSCRVLGRRVEEAVLAEMVHRARTAGAKRLLGAYRPTARNDLVRDHYAKLGFEALGRDPEGATLWALDVDRHVEPDLPMHVRPPLAGTPESS